MCLLKTVLEGKWKGNGQEKNQEDAGLNYGARGQEDQLRGAFYILKLACILKKKKRS